MSTQIKPTYSLLELIDGKYEAVKKQLARYTISSDGCYLWDGPISPSKDSRHEYGVTSIKYLGKSRKIRVHRLSFAFFNGEDPGELFVCHKCDNPLCMNPDHLFLGTGSINMQDAAAKGRLACQAGGNNHNAKLNESEVLRIVELLPHKNNKQIAEIIGSNATHALVSSIRTGKTWSKLTGIEERIRVGSFRS